MRVKQSILSNPEAGDNLECLLSRKRGIFVAGVIKFNRYILLPQGPFCVALTKVGNFKI